MRVLKWLVIGVGVLVLGAIGVGLVLPDTARVERSVVIEARPATVYTVLNGFRQFDQWSPWAQLDPNTEVRNEGPVMGVGARQSWLSDDPAVGAGSQEIIAAEPYARIVVKLVFEGFDSENTATYTLTPQGEHTQLTWSYDSRFHGNLLARYFGLMLDDMIGSDYERGLQALKALVEKLPQTDISDLQVETVATTAQPLLYVSAAAGPDNAQRVLADSHAALARHFEAHGLAQAAAPIAITRAYDEETGHWQFDAGLISQRADPPAAPEAGIRAGTTYAGMALRAVHTGSHEDLTQTYRQLVAFRSLAGLRDNGDSWEQYIGDAAQPDQTGRVTHLYWPVR